MRKHLMVMDFPGPPEVAVVTEKLLDGVWGGRVSAWLWADDWPSANIHFCHTTNSTGLSNHNSPELSYGNLPEQMPSCLKTTVTWPTREPGAACWISSARICAHYTHTGTCRCSLSSNLHFFFWCKQQQLPLALIIIGFLKALCSTLFILCFCQNRNSIRDWGSNSKIRIFVSILRLNSFSICTIGKKKKTVLIETPKALGLSWPVFSFSVLPPFTLFLFLQPQPCVIVQIGASIVDISQAAPRSWCGLNG